MALKTYPNGLRLTVIPKKEAKLISVDMHITSGTQSEKNYESGISEFMSRMLLMGTKNHPKSRDLIAYAKSNGMLLSSDNTSESVVVSISTISENVNKAIDLLCEIAFESLFDISAGDIVRNSMLSDIAKLQENSSYVLEKMINQALFYRTGLANPKFGTNTTISRMTASDAEEFLKRVLTPKNTIISVVGDVDQDSVYEKVMQTFYNKFIQGGEYKKLKYVAPVEDFMGGERTKNKKLNQSRLFLSFPALSYKSVKKYALEISLPIIQRKIAEKLYNVHYFHNEKVVYDIFANNGKFTIEAMVDYEHVRDYLDILVATIKELVVQGVVETEFEHEKNAYLIEFLKRNERACDISKNAAREVAVSKQSYSLASELMKVELITVGDVNNVFVDMFDFTKLYIAYLGNPVEIRALDYID